MNRKQETGELSLFLIFYSLIKNVFLRELLNMAAKKKFYVVWVGRKTGIFEDWEMAKAQIFNYASAKYKSFESKEEAEKAFKNGTVRTDPEKQNAPRVRNISANIIYDSICVDAACSGNPGDMEYRCVDTQTKEQIFHQGPFKEGTNNIGEFLGLVHALALLKKNNREELIIYTDSLTAMAWVRNKKAKTTLKETKRNAIIFELIDRAETWLKENTFKNKILKWETEIWGEIPADFGRK